MQSYLAFSCSELVTKFQWQVLEPFSVVPESGTMAPRTSCSIKASFCPKVGNLHAVTIFHFNVVFRGEQIYYFTMYSRYNMQSYLNLCMTIIAGCWTPDSPSPPPPYTHSMCIHSFQQTVKQAGSIQTTIQLKGCVQQARK